MPCGVYDRAKAKSNSGMFKKGCVSQFAGKKRSKSQVEKRQRTMIKRGLWGEKVLVGCNNCKTSFEINAHDAKLYKHHFCDWDCYQQWQIKTNWFNNRNYNLTEEGREILQKMWSRNGKETWKRKTKEEKQRWIEKMYIALKRKPTRPERMLMMVIDWFNLPYKYVGDGRFWIKNINPDFVNIDGKRVVIEVFGDYWHKRLKTRIKDFLKLIKLRLNGWKRVVIWENELCGKSVNEIAIKLMEV